MVGHGISSAGSYLADPTSPIPSHYAVNVLFKSPSASIVVTSTLVNRAPEDPAISPHVQVAGKMC